MSEKFLSRNVGGERRLHFGVERLEGEPPDLRADDLRRFLILKYDIRPENIGKEGAAPRDMWREIAADLLQLLSDNNHLLGVDMGTSSGYFPQVLLEQGYSGSILGCDITDSHLPNVAKRLHGEFPEANIWFGKADAETMRSVVLTGGDKLEVRDNTFDFSTQLNIHHHTPNPLDAIATAVRVTKPGGFVAFMDRHEGHFGNMYDIGKQVAEDRHATAPESWYSKFDFYMLEEALHANPRLRIVRQNQQAEYLWIPDTDEGWNDYIRPFYTLVPHMRSLINNQRFKRKNVEKYVESTIRHYYFKQHASYLDGYFNDYIFQKYFICEVIK